MQPARRALRGGAHLQPLELVESGFDRAQSRLQGCDLEFEALQRSGRRRIDLSKPGRELSHRLPPAKLSHHVFSCAFVNPKIHIAGSALSIGPGRADGGPFDRGIPDRFADHWTTVSCAMVKLRKGVCSSLRKGINRSVGILGRNMH
jgi:hypothetical protein